MIVYLDNNIWNYLVDDACYQSQHVGELVDAVRDGKLQVLFSPVNLTEINRCFEHKPEKARRMVNLSLQLAPRTIVQPSQVVSTQVDNFLAGRPQSVNDLWTGDTKSFDEVRAGISGNPSYVLPAAFHEQMRVRDSDYVDTLVEMTHMVDAIVEEASKNGTLAPVPSEPSRGKTDLYGAFNRFPQQRRLFLQEIVKSWCGKEVELPASVTFESVPCLAVFLRYHLGFARELIVAGKAPKSGDMADRDQTLYFSYADLVVTSDTGEGGLHPNYRDIINQALQPIGGAAVRFSTFADRLDRASGPQHA